jgi:serine/threonine protein kinase
MSLFLPEKRNAHVKILQALNDVRREIKILSECNHPNIVKYYGSYFKEENLWVSLLMLSGSLLLR